MVAELCCGAPLCVDQATIYCRSISILSDIRLPDGSDCRLINYVYRFFSSIDLRSKGYTAAYLYVGDFGPNNYLRYFKDLPSIKEKQLNYK